MDENNGKYKPMDQNSIKAKLCLSQIKVQQSFKQPTKIFPSLLTTLIYIQCLKYSIDLYSYSWFGKQQSIFSYLDVSKYTNQLPSLATSSIGISYSIFSIFLVFLEKKIKKHVFFAIAKILQVSFGTFLFMWVIGDACNAIRLYLNHKQNTLSLILAIVSIILFTLTICLQTYLRFDFISVSQTSGVVRTSNWSGVSLFFYVLINQLASKLSSGDTPIHLILMAIALTLHIFIYFLKSEHEQDLPFRIQLSGVLVNMLAIVMLACIKLINIKLDIGFLAILSLIIITSVFQLQFFNIGFQLENVNKWSNSQIMIQYAAKMRKVLLNMGNYYYFTLFLGYIEIHQQKCDNQTCPLASGNITETNRKTKFQQIIRKIYNDGCKLSPINPQLVLQYAIFYYQLGSKQKSMKTLLQIKQNDLPLDKYYKFIRLKGLIHRQISQLPNQQFLDLLSQIKVKDLQQQVIKKFQQSALITLQFWSILNQDHPDFRKLADIGKNKVIISQKVHSLYKQINLIAHSQRVTSLYIHYLNQIQNEEKLFQQIESQIKNYLGYETKIVIQDWSNNSSPILIVSCEQQNYGTIIDLNTTCATLLGYQRFDMLGRDIKIIFPGVLTHQIQNFIDPKYMKNGNDQFFYISYSNGYAIKVSRKIQIYSSIQTGLSLIITIQQKFTSNFGFIVFNKQSKLCTLSSTCLQLLNLQDNILQSQIMFSQLFNTQLQAINEQKTIIRLIDLMKTDKRSKKSLQQTVDARQYDRFFNVFKKFYDHFFIISFALFKSNRNCNKNDQYSKIQSSNQAQNKSNFQFQVISQQNQFIFIGTSQKIENKLKFHLQPTLNFQQKQDNNYKILNYGTNITTLRLHENYIKVIQDSQLQSQDGQNKSQASTNNQLIARSNNLSKSDGQKIFQSRQKYCQFIDKHVKKIYLRTGLAISTLLCLALYIGVYSIIKSNYNTIFQSFNRIILQNQIIGSIAQTNRLVLQAKYRSINKNQNLDYLIVQSFRKRLSYLQLLVKSYQGPYMLDVYVSKQSTQKFRSDQFILAYISQFSKLNVLIASASNLTGLVLDQISSLYVQINGNLTKSKMYQFSQGFKKKSYQSTSRALNFIIFLNVGGIIIAILITIILFLTMKKINEYKIQILSVFLQTNQKDIQAYSQKTQSFLITLHVDQSNENNQISQQLMDVKKNSSAMFTKKKRFKSTEFSKSSYFILSTFFLFASAFYIHCLIYNYQKEIFIAESIQYLEIASKYGDVFSSEQAKIDKKLLENLGSNISITDSKLTNQINSNILAYERQYFTAHYKTYGSFDNYHQTFATIFMKDICNGQIKVENACQAGIMARNGTLLLITDITVQNQLIDFSKQLSPQYYISMQTIKAAHSMLLDQIKEISTNFFALIYSNMLTIMLIWSIIIACLSLLIGVYIQRVIVKDMMQVKSMLKFIPVSFAKESQGIKKIVSSILHQQNL